MVCVRDDGEVRYNFTAPKQVLEIFRALCQGKTEPYADLFTGRGGKLMDATKAVKSNTDFDLMTWLVIK